MATINKAFWPVGSVDPKTVINHLRSQLEDKFEGEIETIDTNRIKLEGRPAENWFVSSKIDLSVYVSGSEVKITGEVNPLLGPGTWICFILGLFGGVMFVVGLLLYMFSSGLPEQTLGGVLETLEKELS